MNPDTLVKGDTVVMCDASGGTVDLIFYLIEDKKPLLLHHRADGDGDKCVSIFLDRIFQH